MFPGCNVLLYLQGVSKGATENVLAAELDHQSKPGQSLPDLSHLFLHYISLVSESSFQGNIRPVISPSR